MRAIWNSFIYGKSSQIEYEQLNWTITEGSSLSLLGLIKYDSENDNFVMTELGSMIGGGLQEAISKLKIRIENLN